jgi:hypothetical protein
MLLLSRYRRSTIARYGNRIAILSQLTEPRMPYACGGETRPMDQIDNSRTKPLQTEHHEQMSLGRSQSDVRRENCESEARRDLPNRLTASQHGPVTLLRLSCPTKRTALDDATIAGIESFCSDSPEQTRAIILHDEGKHLSCTASGSIFRRYRSFDRYGCTAATVGHRHARDDVQCCNGRRKCDLA